MKKPPGSPGVSGPGFRHETRQAMGEIELCLASPSELSRLARILDDSAEEPLKRVDALLTISACHLRGMDVSPVESVLEKAAGDSVTIISAFSSGLLAKHWMEKGRIGRICSLYDISGDEARLEIAQEIGSRILTEGYTDSLGPLVIRVLTDRPIIAERLGGLLDMGEADDPKLSAILIGLSRKSRPDSN